jgi:hypothetical protein
MIFLCCDHDMAEQHAFDTGRTSFFEKILIDIRFFDEL